MHVQLWSETKNRAGFKDFPGDRSNKARVVLTTYQKSGAVNISGFSSENS